MKELEVEKDLTKIISINENQPIFFQGKREETYPYQGEKVQSSGSPDYFDRPNEKMSLKEYAKSLQTKIDNVNVKMSMIDSAKADAFIERDFMSESQEKRNSD